MSNLSKKDVIVWLVKHRPGITVGEVAEAMYGPKTQHSYVNWDCRDLVRVGHLRGEGYRPLRLYSREASALDTAAVGYRPNL